MLFCAAMLQREAEREKGKILFNFQNINELNLAQHQRILRKNPDSSLNSHFIFWAAYQFGQCALVSFMWLVCHTLVRSALTWTVLWSGIICFGTCEQANKTQNSVTLSLFLPLANWKLILCLKR